MGGAVADPKKRAKVAITGAALERARIEKVEARARMERAFHAAASAPPPAPSVRSDLDRTLRTLVVGWAALASLALDDRALAGAVPAAVLVGLAAALDRGLHVRIASAARTAPELRLPLVATGLAALVGGALLAASLAVLPPLE